MPFKDLVIMKESRPTSMAALESLEFDTKQTFFAER